MGMLRNKEIRQFIALYFLIAVIVIALGFSINPVSGYLTAAAVAAFGILFFSFTNARYKKIARLSDQIDQVLHNANHLDFDEMDEGELSILQTEITKMILRIREQNDALRKEKGHLADSLADVAHQLRTPLTSVNLILSLLENNPDENERKALIQETKELFGQMDWLLTSLLKISRFDAGIVVFDSKQIETDKLIQNALHPFQIPLDLHNIDVEIDVPKGTIIQGDFGWLSEAIQNILKNCIENAGDNGKIEIVCGENPLFTEITIHDSGKGFEKKDIPHLFTRFYRGNKPNASGYGIGLSLCKMIVTGQGGTITANNHPQGGAIFTLRFPK
jgi:hypothetical protein